MEAEIGSFRPPLHEYSGGSVLVFAAADWKAEENFDKSKFGKIYSNIMTIQAAKQVDRPSAKGRCRHSLTSP